MSSVREITAAAVVSQGSGRYRVGRVPKASPRGSEGNAQVEVDCTITKKKIDKYLGSVWKKMAQSNSR